MILGQEAEPDRGRGTRGSERSKVTSLDEGVWLYSMAGDGYVEK